MLTRRSFVSLAGATAGALLLPEFSRADDNPQSPKGLVKGEPTAEKVGERVLAEGGNAFDAIVAAALTAAIAAPYQTGIGGYGGSAMLATAGGKRITAIDFNSMAPTAMTSDLFARLQPLGTRQRYGWLATGVPGILAGLQLVLDKYGSRSFAELVQPAIELAREGLPMTGGLASSIQTSAAQFAKDDGSRKLYLRDGKPLPAGERFCNPELADMLATLAKRGSVESFYRGDIAQRIADVFQKYDGLVTAKDLEGYQAREVQPLTLTIGDCTIHTAPLAAGGLTSLQALSILSAMKWDRMDAGVRRTHARLEALRLAWRDRLTLLGDPVFSPIPTAKLLSSEYAHECAEQIMAAVKAEKILIHDITPKPQGGTISLSAADAQGNFAALTLTHGESFGARVTVDGLGLTLGHGMSRFETNPNHPNSPGPGKRPLHNMCPTIVTRGGQPVLAVGGRGGRKIPNAMFEALTQFVLLEKPLAESFAAPRVHTEGNATLEFEKHWPEGELKSLGQLGYTIRTGGNATLSAVAQEGGQLFAAMR
jgi:gamma-glutamyltranspeptidase/glutathione hydrolase